MLSEVIEKWGGVPEVPMDLYTDLFHLGEGFIQAEGEAPGRFKANPLIIGHSGGEGGRMHRKIMFEDTFAETLAEFQEMDWAFMSACTYFGRSNSAERQSKLYALVFDIDGVEDTNLNNLLNSAFSEDPAYPIPQHIVLSGHGVHLYYVLEEPLDLYPNIKTQVKELKYALTRRLWNRYTSTIEDPQYQGINQSFRVPGSMTKEDAAIPRCAAYRLNPHPASIGELNGFAEEPSRVDLGARYQESRMSAEEAKERYPDWYARVVEGGERGQWVVKRDLFEWWLRKVRGGATYGHRYFCIMALAIYAAKCGIYDRDEVKSAAMGLVPYLDGLNPEHPFTEADVDSALECLDGRYATFPRSDIARLTDIEIPPNKRNGRKRATHIAIVNNMRKFARDELGEDSYANNGRPKGSGTKRDAIRSYAAEHPEASQREIASVLGVSKTTVNKWLKPGWREEWERDEERKSAMLSLRRIDGGRWAISHAEGHPEAEGRIVDLSNRRERPTTPEGTRGWLAGEPEDLARAGS